MILTLPQAVLMILLTFVPFLGAFVQLAWLLLTVPLVDDRSMTGPLRYDWLRFFLLLFVVGVAFLVFHSLGWIQAKIEPVPWLDAFLLFMATPGGFGAVLVGLGAVGLGGVSVKVVAFAVVEKVKD